VSVPIPNKAGTLVVAGHEKAVEEAEAKLRYMKQLEREVDAIKEKFRALAEEVLGRAPENTARVQFPDGAGGHLLVSACSPESEGNLTQLSEDDLAAAAAIGYDLEALQLVEHLQIVTLRGAWVAWLAERLKEWQSSGVQLPDGLSIKNITRMRSGSFAVLRETISRDPDHAEELRAIMRKGLKSPTVAAK